MTFIPQLARIIHGKNLRLVCKFLWRFEELVQLRKRRIVSLLPFPFGSSLLARSRRHSPISLRVPPIQEYHINLIRFLIYSLLPATNLHDDTYLRISIMRVWNSDRVLPFCLVYSAMFSALFSFIVRGCFGWRFQSVDTYSDDILIATRLWTHKLLIPSC